MFKKNYITLSIVVLSLLLFASSSVFSDMPDFVDPDTPESWFNAPQMASEVGLETFNQSPILDERVERGDLPSVEERLPADPPVIEPLKEIGEYGGMFESWGIELTRWQGNSTNGVDVFQTNVGHIPGRYTPDGKEVVPHLFAGWESEDGKTWTLYLREGMRWSDGHPLTADDIMFWWEHIANNEDLTPVSPEKWNNPVLNVERIDDYTVEITFDIADPILEKQLGAYFLERDTQFGGLEPAHYFKKYHIDFRDKEELMEEAKEAGFDTWHEYYNHMNTEVHPDRPMPTLLPFIIAERHTNYIVGERNPYYPYVDTEGNQLPYIDKIRVNLASNREMVTMKLISGEAHMGTRLVDEGKLFSFKDNEEKGNYELREFEVPLASSLAIMFNLTHEDSDLREVLQDKRFRQAVSLGIDRNEINERVFSGLAKPAQIAPMEGGTYADPDLEKAFVERNIEKAKALLDEMGMKDVDGDGFREDPNGESFDPLFIFTEMWINPTPIMELAKDHLTDIGINLELKMLERSLYNERRSSGKWEMRYTQLGKSMDSSWPLNTGRYLPVAIGGSQGHTPAPEWLNYWDTDGEEGEEPPQEIQELNETAKTLRWSMDEEERINAARKLTQAMAENLWIVGTVKESSNWIYVRNDMRNVPEKGLWAGETSESNIHCPWQFYIKQ